MAGEVGMDFSFHGKKQTHLWDCFCPGTRVYLIGSVEGLKDLLCDSRKFNLVGKIICGINYVLQEVK